VPQGGKHVTCDLAIDLGIAGLPCSRSIHVAIEHAKADAIRTASWNRTRNGGYLCLFLISQPALVGNKIQLTRALIAKISELCSIQGSENLRDLPKMAALVSGKHAERAIHVVPYACIHGRLDLHVVNGKATCRG
jgi:hypothetical protein